MICRRALTLMLFLPLMTESLRMSARAEEEQAFPDSLTTIDPDKDCEFRRGKDKLTITVPAKPHDLHPTRGLNAPRALKKITGDFTVQVKVTADFTPGTQSSRPAGMPGAPFNGAGILIWESKEKFLRIERDAFWSGETLVFYPPLMEYWRNGAYAGFNFGPTTDAYFQGQSTWFKADRTGQDVTVSISHDGKQWSVVKSFQVDMAAEVMVGVDALNSSDQPFVVDFEEFTLQTRPPVAESR
ncbi:MAG: DUF1349 domain-containing protein [Planctomycetes bacterium]|nr:DUF1349 domain-containing protein [Planctomycetota bacterium]